MGRFDEGQHVHFLDQRAPLLLQLLYLLLKTRRLRLIHHHSLSLLCSPSPLLRTALVLLLLLAHLLLQRRFFLYGSLELLRLLVVGLPHFLCLARLSSLCLDVVLFFLVREQLLLGDFVVEARLIRAQQTLRLRVLVACDVLFPALYQLLYGVQFRVDNPSCERAP